MVNRRYPVCVWDFAALAVADGNQICVRIFWEQSLIGWHIESSMQRDHRWCRRQSNERQCEIVQMRVNDVEIPRMLIDLMQHCQMTRLRVNRWIEAERLRNLRDEPRTRVRVAAGEQRDLMSPTCQPFN